MLEGWGRQQRSRRLSGPLAGSRERLVRRFQAFTMAWPWAWTPEQVEAWSGSGGWAHSTMGAAPLKGRLTSSFAG